MPPCKAFTTCAITRHCLYGLILLIICLLPRQRSWAQEDSYPEDSIKKVIAESKVDTARMEALLSYGGYLLRHKLDESGISLINEGKAMAEKVGNYEGIAWAYFNMANYYSRKSDWEKSMEAFQKCMESAEKITDEYKRKMQLLQAYNNLGGIYNTNGDYASSLENRLKCLELLESLPKRYNNNIALATINTASDYRQLKQYGKAKEYINRVGIIFDSISNRLKLEYLYESYHISIDGSDTVRAMRILRDMDSLVNTIELTNFLKYDFTILINKVWGNYEMNHSMNYAKAIPRYQKCYEAGMALDNKVEITSALHNIGWAAYYNKEIPKAINYLQRAYDSAVKYHLPSYTMRAARFLAEILDERGETAKGLFFSRLALRLNDSLANDEKVAQLNFLEAKYQHEKKEKEISYLQQANQENEFVIRRKNWTIAGAAALLVFLLTLAALAWRNYKNKQQLILKEKALQQEQISNLKQQHQVIALQSMINGQEGERTRIARDLHDGLGGIFSTVKMHFSTLQHEVPALRSNTLYRKSFEMVDGASEELRKIAHNMMPEVLMKMGLVPALQDLSNNISAGRQLRVDLQVYGMDKRLSDSTEVMLFRVIQELINNIIKHAGATQAIIQFNRNGNNLHVTVEDNGRGFDMNQMEARPHMGLQTIQNRVAYMNGQMAIDSKSNVGTTVTIDLLLNEQ